MFRLSLSRFARATVAGWAVLPSYVVHNATLSTDEDLPGDHLLAEATLSLKRVLQQSQKKFQVPLERPNLRVSGRADSSRRDFYRNSQAQQVHDKKKK